MQLPNPTYQRNRLGQTPLIPSLSTGAVLGAAGAEAAATNPLSSIFDIARLAGARHVPDTLDGVSDTPFLSIDEQERRLTELGLNGKVTPYEGETEDGLSLRIQWKQDELKRQSIMANHDGGIGTTAAMFGVGLGISFGDPLNILSGFIPVIGAAKYAKMLQQAGGPLGRLGVRTQVGAAEGLVGAAVIEPLVLAGASTREADYGIYDSVANLVFGTALGGGLHGLGGALLDTVQGRQFIAEMDALPPEARGEVLSAGIAAVADGRKPIVMEPLLRSKLDSGVSSAALVRDTTPIITRGIDLPETPAHRSVRVQTAGPDGSAQTFTKRSDAEKHAATLRRQGHKVQVHKVAEGAFKVEIDIDPDVFVKSEAGEFLSYKRKQSARAEMRRLKREGRLENGELIRVRDEWMIANEKDGTKLSALKANPEEIDIPVVLPSGERAAPSTGKAIKGADQPMQDAQPRPQPLPKEIGQRRNAQLDDAARRALDNSNRIFEPEMRRGLEEVEAERIRHPANDDLGTLRAEADAAVRELAEMTIGTGERGPLAKKPSAQSRQAANDVERQLKEAGRPDDQAKAEAQVHGAFAHVLETEYGIAPKEVYGELEIEKASAVGAGRGGLNQPRRTFDANLQAWRERVESLRAGKEPKGADRTALLGRSQPVLRAVEMPDHALVMTDSKIRRVWREHEELPPEVMDDLPALIADPLLIIDDPEKNTVQVFLDSTDANGNPVRAIVTEGISKRGQPQLYVKSVYPLDNGMQRIAKWLRRGDGLYARTRKVLDLYREVAPATSEFSHPNVTRPGQEARSLNRRKEKIVTREDVFKKYGRIYRQGVEETPRGRISFGGDKTLIQLFDGADASTFLHESGHFFVETLQAIAERVDAPARLVADMAVLRRFAEIGDGQRFTVEGHERLARAFEAYMLEGKAPTQELAGVFSRIRDWLVQVYRSIRDLDVELTDEVRGVFDRILASDDQLAKNPLPPEIRAEIDAAEAHVGLVEARGKAMRQAAECVLGAI